MSSPSDAVAMAFLAVARECPRANPSDLWHHVIYRHLPAANKFLHTLGTDITASKFSFNLRTPPSPTATPSGKRIHTMGLHDHQPDQLVKFLIERWAAHPKASEP